jgi:predicted N-formylglutamate amidohydrolase
LKASARKLIISCEHGGYAIPASYRKYFKDQQPILKSHQGWDKGALKLARELAVSVRSPLIAAETSRLLVDLNRSPHHHHLFSEFTRDCDKDTRHKILREYYFPYRMHVENEITKALNENKPVIHFSIHSFIPRLGSEIRNTDIGLLYDPKRKSERYLCITLQSILQDQTQNLIVRRNYPYRGNADGFTTYLRKKYPGSIYIGVEVEINQKHVNHTDHWKSLRKHIINSVIRLKHLSGY